MKALKSLFKLITACTFFILLTLAGYAQNDRSIVDVKQYPSTIKVACIGNSITYGYGIENRDSHSYPAQLGRLLGEKWEVRNYGVSARTLLSKGDLPYINEKEYTDSKMFQPDVVLIMLGTNDTKPQNWKFKAEFIGDYTALIKSFQELESHPKVILLKAVPAFPDRWGITDSIIHYEMNPMVEQVAQKLSLPLVDLYTPFFDRGNLFPDQIHPNAEGAGMMSKLITKALVGNK